MSVHQGGGELDGLLDSNIAKKITVHS